MPDFLLADASDLHALSLAQRHHADALTVVATNLAAARQSLEAFGSVGVGFLTALNDARSREAGHAGQLAERLAAATRATQSAARDYESSEATVGKSLSNLMA